MYSFEFDTINELKSPKDLNDGFYLWIWYADKIPPHIGCSIDGDYFSLKVNGKDNNIAVDKVLSLIQQKKIPSIILKIAKQITIDQTEISYSLFEKAEAGISSCLTPISQLLECSSVALQLSDLLLYLKDYKQIEAIFGLNLKSNYKGIAAYTNKDIENRLLKLKDAKSKKNIPSVG